MVKRLLDANPSDFHTLSPRDLAESIRRSEGRAVMAEIIAIAPPLIDKVSNVELAAAFGADLILMNFYDISAPQIMGLPSRGSEQAAIGFARFMSGVGATLADVKDWIGRPVGLNLEPIERPESLTASGRLASAQNARLAVEQGADFILITGNPNTGVTTAGIARSVREIRAEIGDRALLLAGKMHAAGSYEPVVRAEDIHAFVEAGAEGVAIPAPATTPGMTLELCRTLIEVAHRLGALAMTTIGTSQEGAAPSTVEQIALMSKMAGADIHHIGDSGTFGIAAPENITALSLAIRGRRHTWHRMAASLKR